MKRKLNQLPAALIVAASLALSGCAAAQNSDQSGPPSSGQPANGPITVTDMAGRTVTVPAQVETVATVGLVPPVNSVVFALGMAPKVVNSPPGNWSETWMNYPILAPNTLDAPMLEATINGDVDHEELLKLDPDVVIASGEEMANDIEALGIPTVVVQTGAELNKQAVTLLGEVFGRQDLAREYTEYYDAAVAKLSEVGAAAGKDDHPSLLYLSVSDPMRRPAVTVDWAALKLGAHPVTGSVTEGGWYEFNLEQLLAWDPEVLITMFPSDEETLKTDERFSLLQAVQSGRIYTTPVGAQLWGQTTTENALGFLWLAKTLYPEQAADIDLTKETKYFYSTFFGVDLTDAQVDRMLAAQPPAPDGQSS
ncbi:ABC transporter substrate-binding protein [Actinomyces sp. F1_1611]